jgi:signal transduction histidine kinase
MKNLLFNSYFLLFNFIAKNGRKDLSERDIHSHLVCVIATGFLMWSYTLLAYFTIAHPLPWKVGVTASIIHLFSPLLYRINNSPFLNTNVFLGAGIAHQATFAYFCGGFNSNIIIWFGILPLLAGFICGRRGVVTWVIVCSLVTAGFLFFKISDYAFPNLISPTGLLLSQALITFGWIYVGSIVIWVFLSLVEKREKEIESKKEGIQNLINVIIHDISNPLTSIIHRAKMLKNSELPQNVHDSILKISLASANINDIISNVRNLHATELGKTHILIKEVDLVQTLHSLKKNFSDKLDAKKINLVFSYDLSQCFLQTNEDIFLHQILANLLSNAIKFSLPERDILIRLEKVNNTIHISIKDSGIGIPQDLISKLFDVAANTNRPGTSGEAGTGFGLPIVKTYVEKLNGKITVESISKEDGPNHGTTFLLEF